MRVHTILNTLPISPPWHPFLVLILTLLNVSCSGSDETWSWDLDQDQDGWISCTIESSPCDCADSDPTVKPGATEVCDGLDNDCNGVVDDEGLLTWSTYYPDSDSDGFGTPEGATEACFPPSHYTEFSGDCDDDRGWIHPDADEVCDFIDNDCDGWIDEEGALDATSWYPDGDQDQYGDSNILVISCQAPPDFVEPDGDCDDDNETIYPSAIEICDGIDNNCDHKIDQSDATDARVWYLDSDDDTFGDSAITIVQCEAPVGYVASAGDCADANPNQYPDAIEICDELDNNCNGTVDEPGEDGELYYRDSDGDGYGDAQKVIRACDVPVGYISNNRDCDDGDSLIHPMAEESCDSLDNNCDGIIDEGFSTSLYYPDNDRDGYGDIASRIESCAAPPSEQFTLIGGDCNDTDAAIYPGAYETCDSAIDFNCDGVFGARDDDGDGALVCDNVDYLDCNDQDPTIYPGADEFCNQVDDNCNGSIDEDNAVDVQVWYLDSDSDAYGVGSEISIACNSPEGYVPIDGDCDDSDAYVNPAEVELCDSIDNNCDGLADEATAIDASTYYVDQDQDSFGSDSLSIVACILPNGYALTSDDCDDTDASRYPGAPEYCDNTDNNCNALIDDNSVDAISFFADDDGDHSGDPTRATRSCTEPSHYVIDNADCDDSDPGVYASNSNIYFYDQDIDGFGSEARVSCQLLSGYLTVRGDCNDADNSIYPGAMDVSGDSIDSDCGGTDSRSPSVGYPTSTMGIIQDAIDAADDFSTVWIGPGSYTVSNLSFGGKSLQLIASHGASETILSGNSYASVMTANTSSASPIVVDGFTIRDGSNSGDGANIDVVGVELILRNGEVQSGVAGEMGGGMNASNASLWISATLFSQNAAELGGAIAIQNGSLTLSHSAFIGNSSGSAGGALFGTGQATITVHICTFDDNRASSSGGAINIEDTMLTVEDSSFDNNSANSSGGALNGELGNLSLQNVKFDNNTAAFGGAFALEDCVLNVNSSSFTQNTARSAGGAFYAIDIGDGIVEFCVFSGNEAGVSGSTGYGGAIDSVSSVITFSYNSFTGNISQTYGGAARVVDGSSVFYGCIFEGNYCLSGDGGGLSFGASSTSATSGTATLSESSGRIEECIIAGNEANEGGGIHVDHLSPLILSCSIEYNEAVSNGGGMRLESATPVIEDSGIVYNSAGYGGGLYLDEAPAIIRNVTVGNNLATQSGGGIFLKGNSNSSIENVMIFGNDATYGGGLYVLETSPTLSNTMIFDNASVDGGGGIRIVGASPTIEHCILVSNISTGSGLYGGGIYIANSTATAAKPSIVNSILAYNVNYNLYNSSSNPGTPSVNYSDLYSTGTDPNHNLSLNITNLSVDPLLLEYDDSGVPSDYHLSTSSPLIDRGDEANQDSDGSRADIGAYGGSLGNYFDRDRDGFWDYFWPGLFSNAPANIDASIYDCDDQSSDIQSCL